MVTTISIGTKVTIVTMDTKVTIITIVTSVTIVTILTLYFSSHYSTVSARHIDTL